MNSDEKIHLLNLIKESSKIVASWPEISKVESGLFQSLAETLRSCTQKIEIEKSSFQVKDQYDHVAKETYDSLQEKYHSLLSDRDNLLAEKQKISEELTASKTSLYLMTKEAKESSEIIEEFRSLPYKFTDNRAKNAEVIDLAKSLYVKYVTDSRNDLTGIEELAVLSIETAQEFFDAIQVLFDTV